MKLNILKRRQRSARRLIFATAFAALALTLVPMSASARTIVGTSSDNTLHGTAARDHIVGKRGDDTLYGYAGRDKLVGNQGADTLYGGSARDTLFGGFGTDVLWGGNGNDRLWSIADDGDVDTIHCGDGTDTVHARSTDTVDSDCENVTIVDAP